MTNAEKAVVFLRKLEESGLTLKDLANIIEDVASSNSGALSSTKPTRFENKYGKSLKEEITKLMHELGMPAHLRGYVYIRRSIELVCQNQDLIKAVTKKLYPMLAKEFATTPTGVERDIRHAIEIAWNRGDQEVLNKYFGNTINPNKRRPTNREFFAMILDTLSLKYKL